MFNWGHILRGYGHEKLHQFVLNPAVLVSVGAPILISTCLAFFVSSSNGPYSALAKSPDVCALLEHRTQLYTLIVAFAFCLLQLWKGPLLFHTSQNDLLHRTGRGPGWPLTLTIILVVVFCYSVFDGDLMSEKVVGLYRIGHCELGQVSPFELPPIKSPLTWLRVIILLVALASSFLNLYRISSNAGR